MVDDVLTNGVTSWSANSFPDKCTAIKSGMWSTIGLFLTLVQIIFINLNQLSTSELLIAVVLTISVAFSVIAGIGAVFDSILFNSDYV